MSTRGERGPFAIAVVAALVAVVAAVACGDDADGGEPTDRTEGRETGSIEPARRHQVDKMSPHELAAAPIRSGGRIAQLEGTARRGDSPTAVGDLFVAPEILTTGVDSLVAIDLVREVRVEVGPETEVRRGAAHEAELFVYRGVLRATLPPLGGGSRPSLRIGTPAGSVVLPSAGDALIAVLPSGDTWIAAFAGAAVLSRGEVEGEAGERRTAGSRLLEGRAMLLGRSEIAETTDAPDRLEFGWAAAAQLIAGTPRASSAARTAAAEAAGARFDEAAGWLAAEFEAGGSLADQQRALMETDPTAARELTRDIVTHTQRVIRLKAIVLGRYEQAAAAAGGAGGQISAERASQARGLLTDDGDGA